MAEEAARSRLGRGLAALIGDVGNEAVVDRAARTPRRLPVAFLHANPSNPRKAFRAEDLEDLTSSIRERGVVQPLIVRPVPGARDVYEIVAGERRWRAAQKAGLHDVPVLIREASDKEALELAIIENVQRADLNALEEARGYQQLIDQYHYSQNELADVIGKSRSHIANMLRLLNLPKEVQALVIDGKLSAGHARALLTLDDPLAAAKRILAEGLNVRAVEKIGMSGSGGRKKVAGGRKKRDKDADTRALEKSLSDLLGLAVTIEHKGGRGAVTINYTSLEQLDDVCRRLRG
jgi:ParB family transcriptional regulator, chromosome partitioning protein